MAVQDNLRHLKAKAIFEEIPGIADDMESKPGDEDALEFMQRLAQGPTPEEAVTFAAYMMQPRLAVWWGHECLRSMADLLDPQDETMLGLAADWVAEPTDENRRRALTEAEAASDKSPGVWIAYGAGWSGGSVTAPDQDPVPPPLVLCGRAVHVAALTALARVETRSRADRIKGFVSMADVLARA